MTMEESKRDLEEQGKANKILCFWFMIATFIVCAVSRHGALLGGILGTWIALFCLRNVFESLCDWFDKRKQKNLQDGT